MSIASHRYWIETIDTVTEHHSRPETLNSSALWSWKGTCLLTSIVNRTHHHSTYSDLNFLWGAVIESWDILYVVHKIGRETREGRWILLFDSFVFRGCFTLARVLLHLELTISAIYITNRAMSLAKVLGTFWLQTSRQPRIGMHGYTNAKGTRPC